MKYILRMILVVVSAIVGATLAVARPGDTPGGYAPVAAPATELDSVGRDTGYVSTILVRAAKVTDALGISGTERGTQVMNIVANRYFELNDIYAERDSMKSIAREQGGEEGRRLMAAAEDAKDRRLYRSHFAFDADLSLYLTPEEIITVKDVMTYNVVKVTYEAHCDMIPTLTDEEKAQIMAWLVEAREFAIDAESSKKKHEVFGNYKGRINNYLTKRGYDLQKERAAWEERVKARGGRL